MCYALYRQKPMTAPEAEAFCVGLGGHLASIGNFQEDKYVTGLGDAPLKLRSMWIGLYWNTEGKSGIKHILYVTWLFKLISNWWML